MKTLREYIDQLDEISRRDFLKGAGATAGLAALGAPKTAKAEYSSYSMTDEDFEYIVALCAMMYFGMYGKLRNKAVPAMARDVIQNLKRISTPTLDFLTDIWIMDQLEKLRTNNPDRYNMFLRIAQDQEAPVRIMNRVLRVQDKYINGMSPQDKQRYSSETGHTIQMREEEINEATSPDAVRRIEQLVQYK
jgi:hypothetical protein